MSDITPTMAPTTGTHKPLNKITYITPEKPQIEIYEWEIPTLNVFISERMQKTQIATE